MARSRVLGLWVVCAAMLMARPATAEVALPPDAVGPDTFLVIHIDAAKLSPEAIHQAAAASLGRNADKIVNDQLGDYEQQYQQWTQAGIEETVVIVSGKSFDQEPQMASYSKLKPGADETAVKKLIQKAVASDSAGAWEAQRKGEYLVAYAKGRAPAKKGDAARTKVFADALAGGGDPALFIAFAPTPALRERMRGEIDKHIKQDKSAPQALKDLAPTLLASQWLTISATLGPKPSIGPALDAADEASARKLVDASRQGLTVIRQAMADRMRGMDANQQLPLMAHINHLLDQVQPTQEGAKVTLALKGEVMPLVASALLPAINQARHKANELKTANSMRQLLFAVQVYADNHKGQLPDSLDQLKEYLGGDEGLAKLLNNPRTRSSPGFEYVKPAEKMRDVKTPAKTAILFELKDGQRVPNGVIGYADGHVVVPQTAAPPPALPEPIPDEGEGQ
jgi:hypothetical protein